MNKAERHRLKMVRFKRRCKMRGNSARQHSLRTTSTPCSCMFCDPHKHNPKGAHSTNKRALTNT